MSDQQNSIVSKIAGLPLIGGFFRWSIYIIRLPRKIDNQIQSTNSLGARMEAVSMGLEEVSSKADDLRAANQTLKDQLNSVDNKVTDAVHQITVQSLQSSSQVLLDPGSSLLADDHSLDQFYIAFENKFRGPEKEIIERQKTYLKHFAKIKSISKKYPVLDIGCGRGEFLEVLRAANITAKGLDLNSTMVKRSREKGFDVIENDALSYLIDQKSGAFSAITGFHIVEHIPFSDLMNIYKACYRAVANDGFVLFETPNPENLSVGAFSFYYDPSHLKPIPPKLLAFCLEFVGFSKVKIIYLHPEIKVPNNDEINNKITNKLFGPRDYAVIAYKN